MQNQTQWFSHCKSQNNSDSSFELSVIELKTIVTEELQFDDRGKSRVLALRKFRTIRISIQGREAMVFQSNPPLLVLGTRLGTFCKKSSQRLPDKYEVDY